MPNLAHTDVILNLLNDQFDYQEIGLLDNTHIHFFTYESLQKIVEKTGLEAIVKKATYCSVGFAADILDMLSSNTCAKRRSIPFLFDYDRFIPTQLNSLRIGSRNVSRNGQSGDYSSHGDG